MRAERIAIVAAAIVTLFAGCDDREEKRDDTVIAVAPSLSPRPLPGAAKSGSKDPCPATGRWAQCSLEKRLRRSGFVVTKIDGKELQRPGFSVEPVVYKLGRGRLEVFLYEDAGQMKKDLAGLDTVVVAPRGTTGEWPSAPALVHSGNLAAVFMDQNPRQAERLVLAITAGAPLERQ